MIKVENKNREWKLKMLLIVCFVEKGYKHYFYSVE